MTEPFYDRQGITIYHGDCQSVLPQLATASVHFVLTDPPYLVGYRGRWDSPNEQISATPIRPGSNRFIENSGA